MDLAGPVPSPTSSGARRGPVRHRRSRSIAGNESLHRDRSHDHHASLRAKTPDRNSPPPATDRRIPPCSAGRSSGCGPGSNGWKTGPCCRPSWSATRTTAGPARSARPSSTPTPPPARRTRSTSTSRGAAVQTIAAASLLPAVTDPVVIDGTSQPGYAGSPLIAVVGQSTGSLNPLPIGSDVTIRGLAIPGYTFPSESAASTLSVESAPFPGPEGGHRHHSNRHLRGRGADGGGPGGGRLHVAVAARRTGRGPPAERRRGDGRTRRRDQYFIPAGTYSLQVQGERRRAIVLADGDHDAIRSAFPTGTGRERPRRDRGGGFRRRRQARPRRRERRTSDDVSILMGNGDGTFQPRRQL